MRDSRTASRKIALCAMLMALAMIFSYVEVLIPINLGVPGIKLGIANLVVVVGLFFLPAGEVLMISVARILLMGYLFGNGMSILYSLAGGLLSFLVMLLLKHIKGFSITGYSFLVFNLLCAPCFAAIGAIKREMNNAKWTWFAIGYQCGFAYVIALMINQFGSLFTGSANVLGVIVAVILLAGLIYMLVRPYKEATKLSARV